MAASGFYAYPDIDATVGYIAARADQAMLSDTVEVAGTASGIAEPQAVFSACYARMCYYIFLMNSEVFVWPGDFVHILFNSLLILRNV